MRQIMLYCDLLFYKLNELTELVTLTQCSDLANVNSYLTMNINSMGSPWKYV